MKANQYGDKTPEQRFAEKFTTGDSCGDSCWNWEASCDQKGYGQFSFNRTIMHAHRVAWELYCGPIPSGMCVLHRCDNRQCVNPDHLFLGTIADNNHDMVQKGRHSHGAKHALIMAGGTNGCAKLTEVDVREIRRSAGYLSRSQLAKRFGVSRGNIDLILEGRTWKQLEGNHDAI
ncbi:MAG: HNH endonuclease [Chloroflexota bacterium]